jgi:hypothetical protein
MAQLRLVLVVAETGLHAAGLEGAKLEQDEISR